MLYRYQCLALTRRFGKITYKMVAWISLVRYGFPTISYFHTLIKSWIKCLVKLTITIEIVAHNRKGRAINPLCIFYIIVKCKFNMKLILFLLIMLTCWYAMVTCIQYFWICGCLLKCYTKYNLFYHSCLILETTKGCILSIWWKFTQEHMKNSLTLIKNNAIKTENSVIITKKDKILISLGMIKME